STTSLTTLRPRNTKRSWNSRRSRISRWECRFTTEPRRPRGSTENFWLRHGLLERLQEVATIERTSEDRGHRVSPGRNYPTSSTHSLTHPLIHSFLSPPIPLFNPSIFNLPPKSER